MTPDTPRSRGLSTMHTRVSIGSYGAEPSVMLNPFKNTWEINSSPSGPGVCVTFIHDRLMQKICEAFLLSRSPEFIRSFSDRIISNIERARESAPSEIPPSKEAT